MTSPSRRSPPHRARALAGFLVLMGACKGSGTAGPLDLVLPLTGSERGIILAAAGEASQGSGLAVQALAIGRTGTIAPLLLPLSAGERLELTALLYRSPLAALRVRPGGLPPAVGVARALPDPAAILTAEVVGGEGRWTPASSLPPAVAAYRIQGFTPCLTFTATAVPVVFTTSPSPGSQLEFAFAAHLASPPAGYAQDGIVLWANDGMAGVGVPYFVDHRGVAYTGTAGPALQCGSRADLHAEAYSGFQAQDGTMWIGGRCGTIYQTTTLFAGAALGGDWSLHHATHRDNVIALDGARDGPLTEVFALGSRAAYDRYDTAEARSTGILMLSQDQGEGGIAYVGPDEAVGVWSKTASVVRMRHDQYSFERLPAHLERGPSFAVHVPGFGTVVATDDEQLFLDDGSGWRPLPLTTRASSLVALVPYRNTFLLAEPNGVLRQYSTETLDACAPQGPLPQRPDGASRFVVVGDEIALVGSTPGAPMNLFIRWLKGT